jgi:hypothetical protein
VSLTVPSLIRALCCVRTTLRMLACAGALVDNVVTGPLIAIVRASGKPEGKLLAVKILRELTADAACQPRLVEKGAVRVWWSFFVLHCRNGTVSLFGWLRVRSPLLFRCRYWEKSTWSVTLRLHCAVCC